MRSILVAVLFVVGCDKPKPLEWKPQAITTFDVGPFHFDVPPGWRDVSESKNPALATITHQLGPDAHMIVREKDSNTDTNIAVMWSDGSDQVSCTQFVDILIGQAGADGQNIDRKSVHDEAMGSDKGCSLALTDHGQPGRMWLRFHGDHMLTVMCLLRSGGDADGDSTCTRMAAAMKAQ